MDEALEVVSIEARLFEMRHHQACLPGRWEATGLERYVGDVCDDGQKLRTARLDNRNWQLM